MKAGIGRRPSPCPTGWSSGPSSRSTPWATSSTRDGRVVAGVLNADGTLADVRRLLRAGDLGMQAVPARTRRIGVVATNARLSKAQVTRMAAMADDGLASAIVPAHTPLRRRHGVRAGHRPLDGEADVTLIGALAAEVMSEAIVRAATQATTSHGVTGGARPARE